MTPSELYRKAYKEAKCAFALDSIKIEEEKNLAKLFFSEKELKEEFVRQLEKRATVIGAIDGEVKYERSDAFASGMVTAAIKYIDGMKAFAKRKIGEIASSADIPLLARFSLEKFFGVLDPCEPWAKEFAYDITSDPEFLEKLTEKMENESFTDEIRDLFLKDICMDRTIFENIVKNEERLTKWLQRFIYNRKVPVYRYAVRNPLIEDFYQVYSAVKKSDYETRGAFAAHPSLPDEIASLIVSKERAVTVLESIASNANVSWEIRTRAFDKIVKISRNGIEPLSGFFWRIKEETSPEVIIHSLEFLQRARKEGFVSPMAGNNALSFIASAKTLGSRAVFSKFVEVITDEEAETLGLEYMFLAPLVKNSGVPLKWIFEDEKLSKEIEKAAVPATNSGFKQLLLLRDDAEGLKKFAEMSSKDEIVNHISNFARNPETLEIVKEMACHVSGLNDESEKNAFRESILLAFFDVMAFWEKPEMIDLFFFVNEMLDLLRKGNRSYISSIASKMVMSPFLTEDQRKIIENYSLKAIAEQAREKFCKKEETC